MSLMLKNKEHYLPTSSFPVHIKGIMYIFNLWCTLSTWRVLFTALSNGVMVYTVHMKGIIYNIKLMYTVHMKSMCTALI